MSVLVRGSRLTLQSGSVLVKTRVGLKLEPRLDVNEKRALRKELALQLILRLALSPVGQLLACK